MIHEYREVTPAQGYRMAREEAGALREMVRRLLVWLQRKPTPD